MEYTVQKLGRLAGISTRTLRYYDEIGLLKPARTNSAGYRIYGRQEVDKLQQILFYRELGVKLERINELVSSPDFDKAKALHEHRTELLERKEQLDRLIANVEKTIALNEGRIPTMTDREKFEGFKKQMIDENERKYGEEIRDKYGDEAMNESNAKLMGMSKGEHEEAERLTEQLYSTLAEAFKTGNPAGELAQRAADLHRQWLSHYWTDYSKEAHANLAQMYVDDERFTAHYDAKQPGTAQFLRDAIHIYTGVTS